MASLKLAGALAAMALGVATAQAENIKPQVLVQFEIAVPAFQRNLPQRADAEEDVRKALAEEFSKEYVFASWPTKIVDHPQAQLGKLLVKLEQDATTAPGPRVFVRLYGSGAGADAKAVDLGLDPIEIYSPTNPNWDTNSRRDFQTRLLGKTLEKLRTDAFQDEFFKRFLARLPIASAVLAQPTEHVIEIPVNWNENLLSSETVLMVRFDKSVNQTKLEGTMKLGQIAGHMSDPAGAALPAKLRGSITEAMFDAKSLQLDANKWNERLPEILSDAKAYCFIIVYKPRDELTPDNAFLLGVQ